MRTLTFSSTFHADKVDTVNGVIRGVSVITSGVTARGHDLAVDETTLRQMQLCAQTKGKVPVKVDHKSGAGAVCGFLTDFSVKEGKLKADWHLLDSHPQRNQILEAAARMPEGVGLSAAFVPPEGVFYSENGKPAARCEELISVDYVALPAANPTGLFEANVDTQFSTRMSTNANTPAGEPSLADLLAAIQSVQQQNQQFAQRLDAMEQAAELQQNPPTIEDLAGMSDEELASIGLTREEVNEAVSEALASEDGEGIQEGSEGVEGSAESDGSGDAAAAPAGAGASTGFNALQKRVLELEAKLAQAEKQEKVDREAVLFSEIEGKMEALLQENEALRNIVEFGASAPVSAGVADSRIRHFGAKRELTVFEQKVEQLRAQDPKLTKFKAFEAVRAADPDAFIEFQQRKGVIALGE